MKFSVTTREGQALELQGSEDVSVMEAIRDGGVDELQALCGGQLSCATCHVYIDDDHVDQLPDLTDFENELLNSSDHRQANSRLACQIPCSSELTGLHVTIAPED